MFVSRMCNKYIPNIFGGFAIALTLASSIIALISIVIGFARYVWEKL